MPRRARITRKDTRQLTGPILLATSGLIFIIFAVMLPQIMAIPPQAVTANGGLVIYTSTDKFFYNYNETVRWNTSGWAGSTPYSLTVTLRNGLEYGKPYGVPQSVTCNFACAGQIPIPAGASQGSYYIEVKCASTTAGAGAACPKSPIGMSAFFDIGSCPPGTCIIHHVQCLAGTHWSGSKCVADEVNCPTGSHWDSAQNSCVGEVSCPAGSEWDLVKGACVANAGNCPAGSHYDATQGKCVADSQSCPVGSDWNNDLGKCIANTVTCPAGSYWDGTTCLPNNPPTCPADMHWDSATGACVATANYTLMGQIGLAAAGVMQIAIAAALVVMRPIKPT